MIIIVIKYEWYLCDGGNSCSGAAGTIKDVGCGT